MTNEHNVKLVTGFGFVLSLVIGAIGALARHSLWAGFAFFLLAILVDFVAWLGFVPGAGPFLYWLVFEALQSFLFRLAGVRPGLLAELVFIYGLIISIIYTVISCILVLFIVVGVTRQ